MTFHKKTVKRLLALLYYFSGRYKTTHNGKIIILMYHRIIPKKDVQHASIQPGMYVSTESFEKQIQYLTKYYTILSLNEFLNLKANDIKKDKQYCVLTFDDGWKDNYDNAFPVLKANKITATIFLPTDFIGIKNFFWPERLSTLIEIVIKGKLKKERLYRLVDPHLLDQIILGKNNKKNEYFSRMVESLKLKNALEIVNILDKIEGDIGTPKNPRKFLNWQEIEEMSAAEISFGSHGISHQQLTKLSEAEASTEIADSKEVLKNKHIHFTNVFCYPNGSYNSKIKNNVKQSGYDAAVSTKYGCIEDEDNQDIFALNRIGVHNDISANKIHFALHISGILQRFQ